MVGCPWPAGHPAVPSGQSRALWGWPVWLLVIQVLLKCGLWRRARALEADRLGSATSEKRRPSRGRMGTRGKWYLPARYTGCWAVYSMCSWEKHISSVLANHLRTSSVSHRPYFDSFMAPESNSGGFRVGSVPVLTVSKQSKEFGGVWGVSCLRSSSVVFRVQTAQSFAPPSDQQAL